MRQEIHFAKMHGIGNDFILVDNREQNIIFSDGLITNLANRHTGIGFDQLIVLDDSTEEKCDAAYRFFNPDGSPAEQCGNGQRCIALYLNSQNSKQEKFCVSGMAGKIRSILVDRECVKVNMGKVTSIRKYISGQREMFHVLFGNPHLVVDYNGIDTCDLTRVNEKYTTEYPEGINLEIAEIITKNTIKIRVHERGTGETNACGSGACAAVAALQNNGQLDNKVKVILPGGTLMVEYNKQNRNFYLTGPAKHVFSGEITV